MASDRIKDIYTRLDELDKMIIFAENKVVDIREWGLKNLKGEQAKKGGVALLEDAQEYAKELITECGGLKAELARLQLELVDIKEK